MRWIAIAAFVFWSSAALAQPKQLTIQLTQDEWQFVLNKLSENPWKEVNPVMTKIITQLNAQMAPPPPATPPPAPGGETK